MSSPSGIAFARRKRSATSICTGVGVFSSPLAGCWASAILDSRSAFSSSRAAPFAPFGPISANQTTAATITRAIARTGVSGSCFFMSSAPASSP